MWVLFVKLVSPAPWFLEPKPRTSKTFAADIPIPFVRPNRSASPASQPRLTD